jgi:DNA-binding MarR family transcriptional regulator
MGHSKRISPECEMATCCLASQLRLLSRVISNLYDDALRPHGIRMSQMNILVALAVAGPVRAVDVARRLYLDTSTLSRDLERLIERKWVQSAPGKGRARTLEITASGRALLTKTHEDWRESQRQAREMLTPAAADAIAAAVTAVRAADKGS